MRQSRRFHEVHLVPHYRKVSRGEVRYPGKALLIAVFQTVTIGDDRDYEGFVEVKVALRCEGVELYLEAEPSGGRVIEAVYLVAPSIPQPCRK